ncbi:MAG: SxtJ family membrane protein [Patescibacteria group bacterium]
MSFKKEIRSTKSSRSDLRKFGLVVGLVFFGFGIPLLFTGSSATPYLSGLGAILVILGLFYPSLLKIPYRLWMILALLMGWVMSRVILTFIFFLVFTPLGFFAKLSDKDFLKLKRKENHSYWVSRPAGNYEKKSIENQF